jgi:galactose mutarotase-like enzyme
MIREIKNSIVNIKVEELGAELQSLFAHDTEYLWQGDPQWWPRRAPILFPIVGKLRFDQFVWEGESYRMSQHGFARDMMFDCIVHESDRMVFQLQSSTQTLSQYPFNFNLEIEYSLRGPQVWQTFRVYNQSNRVMPFSIGAHPAFNVPLEEGLSLDDYEIRFEQVENADAFHITNGLFDGSRSSLLNDASDIRLSQTIFNKDALVFKNLRSKLVSIVNDKGRRCVIMDYNGFPYFALWAKPGAPYVCLEPWCGLGDTIDADGDLRFKEGMIFLEPNRMWQKALCITLI